MMRRLSFFIIMVICAAMTSWALSRRTTDALRLLDKEIDARQHYIDRRTAHIGSLKTILAADSTNIDAIMGIASAYTNFDNDSVLAYYTRGLQFAHGADSLQMVWLRSSVLPLAGMFERALYDYNSIDPDSVPVHLLTSYLDSGRKMYSYLSGTFRDYPEYSSMYRRKSLDMQKQLLELLPHDGLKYKYNLGEYYFFTDRKVQARVLMQDILDNHPADNRYAARAAYRLALMEREIGDEDAYIYYLTQSALADLRSANHEVVSFRTLGIELHDRGDMTRAHRYLSLAISNANECHAMLRMTESARVLPILERTHQAEISRWHNRMLWLVIVMVLLIAAIAMLSILLRRRAREKQQIYADAKAQADIAATYRDHFLQLCSLFMDKMNHICRVGARKLNTGNVDELLRMMKSGRLAEEQTPDFYNVFDSAFLSIYPHFVDKVNALLLPDAQIELKDGERMNADMRILALICLGIDDSNRLAQILNYSVNTIYSYRNRLRMRAIDRDNFENDIRAIGA